MCMYISDHSMIYKQLLANASTISHKFTNNASIVKNRHDSEINHIIYMNCWFGISDVNTFLTSHDSQHCSLKYFGTNSRWIFFLHNMFEKNECLKHVWNRLLHVFQKAVLVYFWDYQRWQTPHVKNVYCDTNCTVGVTMALFDENSTEFCMLCHQYVQRKPWKIQ